MPFHLFYFLFSFFFLLILLWLTRISVIFWWRQQRQVRRTSYSIRSLKSANIIYYWCIIIFDTTLNMNIFPYKHISLYVLCMFFSSSSLFWIIWIKYVWLDIRIAMTTWYLKTRFIDEMAFFFSHLAIHGKRTVHTKSEHTYSVIYSFIIVSIISVIVYFFI